MDAKWQTRFLELATHVASWSKDPSTQVGAVIVDEYRIVRGVGYNGFPRGIDDTVARLQDRHFKYPLTVHAEANAILNSNGSVRGCTLFVTAHPCVECAKLIVQSGISIVRCPEPEGPFYDRWALEIEFARVVLREGGVLV